MRLDIPEVLTAKSKLKICSYILFSPLTVVNVPLFLVEFTLKILEYIFRVHHR